MKLKTDSLIKSHALEVTSENSARRKTKMMMKRKKMMLDCMMNMIQRKMKITM